ncbi:MAG: VWA domain-containing protein [Acidobacteriota bacterium]
MTGDRRGGRVALRWIVIALAVSAASLRGSSPGAEGQAPQPTFRSGVELVAVEVGVVGPDGTPVTGLGPDDFEVAVDGRPRRVVSVGYADFFRRQVVGPAVPPLDATFSSNDRETGTGGQERFVVLAIDQASFTAGSARSAIEAAKRFVDRLGEFDRVALAAFPRPGPVVWPTTDREAIRKALSLVAGRAEPVQPPHPDLHFSVSEALDIAGGDTRVLDAVYERECSRYNTPVDLQLCRTSIESGVPVVIDAVRTRTWQSLSGLQGVIDNLKAIEGRKTVVLLSAGIAGTDERSVLDYSGELRRIAESAAACNCFIYALHVDRSYMDAFDVERVRVSESLSRDAALMTTGLDTIVGMNGGARYRVVAGADFAFERVSREIAGYYLLAVEADPSDRDGRPHRIRVRVARRGVQVRSRPQFTIARPEPEAATAEDRVARLLRTGEVNRDLPIRVSTQSMRERDARRLNVYVRADIGRFVTGAADLHVGLSVIDSTGREAGTLVERKTMAPLKSGDEVVWPYSKLIVLEPGVYTLRVAAAREDGALGSAAHRFEAKLGAGEGAQLSDLLMLDAEQTAGDQLLTMVDGRLRSTRLGTYVEVYPERGRTVSRVTFALAEQSGVRPILTVEGTMRGRGPDGRVRASAEIDVQLLEAGDYVATATAFDGEWPVGQVSRPFRIEPAAELGRSLRDAASPAQTFLAPRRRTR